MTATAAMLAQYPGPIAQKICDPIRGLPASSKFLPAIAEIREACEREMIWNDAVGKRERERAHTRQVLQGHKAPVGSPEHKRVAEAFKNLRGSLDSNEAAPGASVSMRAPRSPAEAEVSRRRHEARLEELAKAAPAQPSTPELGAYLARMREAAEAGLTPPPLSKRDERAAL